MSTAVFALGSVLMGDDGVGAALLAWLEAHWELPSEVERADLGTPGPDLSDWLAPHEAVVFLDAVRLPGEPPGTVRLVPRAELVRATGGPRVSPHDPGIGEALLKAELAGEGPRDAVLIGIVPERIGLGTDLSPAVAVALPDAAELVVGELRRLGERPVRRARPLPPETFWNTARRE